MSTPAIRIQGVSKHYGSLKALGGVDLEVGQGEFFGLLGPNGAGKTTLISALSGLVRPDSGTLAIMGHDVVVDYRNARRNLGVVPQELVFDPFFSVRELLRIQSGYFGIRSNDDWIDEILASLDLTHKASANMRMLSGGMKRRVLVAQALVHRPPVIVLDEPTAGVDVELRQTLWQFIKRLNADGHTILLTTHYLEEAETLCNRIAMLKQGKVIALDSKDNFLNRHAGVCLRLKLAGPPPVELAAPLHGNSDGSYSLQLAELSQLEPLLAALRQARVEVLDLAIEQPSLEDVFLRVMHRREAA